MLLIKRKGDARIKIISAHQSRVFRNQIRNIISDHFTLVNNCYAKLYLCSWFYAIFGLVVHSICHGYF
jgi:hypothetical protein